LPIVPDAPEDAIEQGPAESAPEPLCDRARALADEGKLVEAHALCETALARDPLDVETHLLMAAICQERGAIPRALDAIRRAIFLAPDCAIAHFLLGSLLLMRGDHERGRRSMDTVVRLLDGVPPDAAIAGSDGLAAGRVRDMARAHLETT
jgi:chemotaxis protein methyltransferase CheR